MVRNIQDHAVGDKKVKISVYLNQIDKQEKENNKLKTELETINLKQEREIYELISQAKKSEYSLVEANSRKDIEIQKLQLEKQKIILEKDSAFEKFKAQIEVEFKEIKDSYNKEKNEMNWKLEQATIQAKAFQMLNANETYLSPVIFQPYSI